jgi:putative SOS response-associated peptidase YedK
MSSRYALYETNKLHDRFAPKFDVPKGVKPHYNISPAQSVPVIINKGNINQIKLMKWGFIPKGAKDTNSIFRYKTFNVRSEIIFDKPTWADSVRTRRCLIPANGFYEWKKSATGKDPYYIKPTDQSLFGIAGIYSIWTDPNGVDWDMCSMITIGSDTDDDMTPSRLPIIINPADEADWLNPDITDINLIYKTMRPYSPNQLTIIRVGEGVNSTKIDKPELIERYVRK